ncbi:MAG: peptide deformylase [Chitinispirillia bacterium]|jgi:peptide deformylase
MADIRIYGDPILRKTARPVELFDDKLRTFIEQMKVDMYEKDGIGLAAPQIGESIRIVIIDISEQKQEPIVLINPRIYYFSEDCEDYDEGCLSIPDITVSINRPKIVSVSAFNERGKSFSIEKADGLLARAIQHECDHLDGILFVDRATPVRRQLLSGKLKKLAKSHRDAHKN